MQIEETDHKILELLNEGLADAAIARQLGLSHRTVQRRVGNLMATLQVKGRLALGVKIHELGLLNPQDRSN
ncbi:LuxR C-terminal-related transcriptional regulator [Streptomyces chartreusis]|uniref:LuxR C-terminal-related transcriptional regulator n=1 Tax=Streptomyces chartreusis TaxID=1969 RepID=UPI0037A93040